MAGVWHNSFQEEFISESEKTSTQKHLLNAPKKARNELDSYSHQWL